MTAGPASRSVDRPRFARAGRPARGAGSTLSTAYVVASTLALASRFAVSLLAYLHRLPTVQVVNGETDTAALPLPIELYFGGPWFAISPRRSAGSAAPVRPARRSRWPRPKARPGRR